MASRRLRPHRASMLTKVNLFVKLALSWLFSKVTFGQHNVDAIRDADDRGRVVYLLQTRSLFDQLYFNYAFLKHELPLATWSNGPRTFWLRPFLSMIGYLFRRKDRRSDVDQLEAHVEDDEAVLIFLERPFGRDQPSETVHQRYLERLVELQQRIDEPILLVPLLAIWERRNEDFNPSLLDGVFGTRQRPGFFRKIFHVIKNLWQAFFVIGPPLVQVSRVLDLSGWLQARKDEASDPPAVAAEVLRDEMTDELEQERSVVVGPRVKKAAAVKREILDDDDFIAEVEAIAERRDKTTEEMLAEARKNFDAIAADYSPLFIKFLAVALTPVFQLIYDGLEVDEAGLEKVREAARDGQIVVIPSHKSHIDYLIISYLFFEYGFVPPHIAAGDNLNFPPVGTFFRRSGAFFIRRSFKGDDLYALCLKRYLGKLILEGHPIEFFIEGGRSRVGKLLSPRFGMLRMVVESYLEQPTGPIRVVPCNVTYERVIESQAHQHEVKGGKKKKENISALLRSTRVLTSRYGRLYVTFGDPIDLGEYLQRYSVEPGADESSVGQLTQRLGYRVIYEINQAGTATPSAVAALVLLNSSERGLPRKRLLELVGFVLDLLNQKGVRLSPSLQKALASRRAQLQSALQEAGGGALLTPPFMLPDNDEEHEVHLLWGRAVADLLDEALKLFSDSNLIDITTVEHSKDTDERFFYRVPEKARGELSYYRNMIIHAFVPDALLSAALLEPGKEIMDVDPVMERTLLLSKLFKYEFFYEERAEFENVFWRTVEQFEARGWLQSTQKRAGQIVLAHWPMHPIEYYRDMLLTFLEAYTLVCGELDFLEDRWVAQQEFIDHILLQCQVHYHEGRVRFVETLAKPTFINALRRYVDWGYVETETEESGKKRIRQYRLVADKDHQELLGQLRSILRGRSRTETLDSEAA